MFIPRALLFSHFIIVFVLLYSSQIFAAMDPDYRAPETKAVARNDITDIIRDPSEHVILIPIVGNVTLNDENAVSAILFSPMESPYGSLAFRDDGSYVYTLFNDKPEIRALDYDEHLSDVFTYIIYNPDNDSAYATLTINILGNTDEVIIPVDPVVPTAFNDVNYITRDPNTAITSLVITDSVANNDQNANNFNLISPVVSPYGILALSTDGSYTYALFNNLPAVTALGYNETLIDTFTYQVSSTTDHKDTATLIINILGIANNNLEFEAGTDPINVRNDTNNITRDPDAGIALVTTSGNVGSNDGGIDDFNLISDSIGFHGSLTFLNTGEYIYTLFNQQDEIINLNYNEYLTEKFTYQANSSDGRTGKGTLTINIFGALGIVSDNVEIEPNDRSMLSTPLNSAQNIRGHLQSGDDKDWYSIKSLGNEIIHLEICPPGSGCFSSVENKSGAWVMYVFDSSKLTYAEQLAQVDLHTIGEDTGTIYNTYTSDQMYLKNSFGLYDNSLIGIIDPCFGKTSGLDIGVGNGAKTYFIAISSPLQGGGPEGVEECGVGSVILEEPGPKGFYEAIDEEGVVTIEEEATIKQHIIIFPRNDDQYLIEVSRTGINPLTDHSVPSALLKDGNFMIPKLRIDNALYAVNFNLKNSNNSATIKLDLTGYQKLDEALTGEQLMATYDSSSNLVRVPKYLNEQTQELYSMIFFYNPVIEVLELVEYKLID